MINVDLRKQPYNLDDEGVKWGTPKEIQEFQDAHQR